MHGGRKLEPEVETTGAEVAWGVAGERRSGIWGHSCVLGFHTGLGNTGTRIRQNSENVSLTFVCFIISC